MTVTVGVTSSAAVGGASDTADRILDAAGRCFAARGVRGTTIADVARAAGVSRPTVYRWYADRDVLLTAFVQRAARRLGAEVATTRRGDAGRDLVDAVLTAVDGVRADPTLAAWFSSEAAGAALGAASASPVIEALAAAFLRDGVAGTADDDVRLRARWVVRVTVSLLAMPGRDRAEERALLERFLVPVVIDPAIPAAARRTRTAAR